MRCLFADRHNGHVGHVNQSGQDAQPVHSNDDGHVPRTPELPSARVEADLRRRLAAGEWASGDPMPTVALLAEHYEVARGTVARALRTLEGEELVRIVARWGTFKT